MGYRAAMLDTQPSAMPQALALYRRLGFTEFQPEHRSSPLPVIYLCKDLP
jgi:ribosomal protein S18 acetylase RimI-like enzyme